MRIGRILLIGLPYLWLLFFFLVPFIIVLKIALSDTVIAQPPYRPLLDLSEGLPGLIDFLSALDLESFEWLLSDDIYVRAFISSLLIAATSTILTLLIAFPLAYAMSRAAPHWRTLLVMAVIMPFWTSFLIRVYAWIGILRTEGLLNQFLLWTGLIDQPLHIMNTNAAVLIGIVYSYLPFMVLPIYAALERLDDSLLEAAIDLGCSRLQAFWLVTLPLAAPGVIAGCFLVFIPAVGEFVIPDLLGGSETLMMGRMLWVEFFANRDWPVASAVAIALLLMLVAPIVAFQRIFERQQEEGR